MPTFEVLKTSDEVNAIAKSGDDSRKKQSRIVNLMSRHSELAEANAQAFEAAVTKGHTDAKAALVELAARAKAFTETRSTRAAKQILPELRLKYEKIKGIVEELAELNDEYFDSMESYRQGGWEDTARDLGEYATEAVEDCVRRRGALNNRNKIILGQRKRIDEYLNRAKIVYKSSATEAKSLAQDEAQAKEGLAKRQKRVEDQDMLITGELGKTQAKINNLRNYANQATLTLQEYKIAEGLLLDLDQIRKTVSGGLKTMKMALESYRKIADSVSGQENTIQQFKTQTANHERQFKELRTRIEAIRKKMPSMKKKVPRA